MSKFGITVILFFLCFVVEFHQAIGQTSTSQNKVFFNSDWLEKRWAGYKPASRPSVSRVEEKPSFSFSDRNAVISYVLRNCGDQNTVYPSEQYYYFKFYLGHRLVSGNLRFCDSNKNIVHFGYFDEYDRSLSFYGKITNKNGNVRREGNNVRLVFQGLTRNFRLFEVSDLPPKRIIKNEEFISSVLDESGFYFSLVFNNSINRFYYILEEKRDLPEKLAKIESGGQSYFVGIESRFIFYNDPANQRKILVGVLDDNIRWNNYFDGPFDQVPPDLNIKSKLELVYPYVKLRGGIDLNGNFNKIPGSRVAISPYQVYSSTFEFLHSASSSIELVSGSNEVIPFIKLIYESKIDFHKKLSTNNLNKEKAK